MYIPAWPTLAPQVLVRRGPKAPPPFPIGAPGALAFYVARYAIYQLFRGLGFDGGDTVLVPAYHHGNEVRAIRASGATVRFYPIDRRLQPDLNEIERLCRRERPRALFVIHFLGWPQPIRELDRLCRERGMILIEDCALALLSQSGGRPLGSFGDYSVFCLYKTLPVPHGGLLVQNRGSLGHLSALRLRGCGALSVAARSAELTLGWLRSRFSGVGGALAALKQATGTALTGAGLARRPVGDAGFDPSNADVGMSPVARALLRRLDYGEIVSRRRRNFALMKERLAGRAVLREDLPTGVCPLFFPLLVRDKADAVRGLLARGIETVPFWNEGDPEAEAGPFPHVRFLREHVLELPIHQDVTPRDVDYMAEQVLRLDACAAPAGLRWLTSNASTLTSASTA